MPDYKLIQVKSEGGVKTITLNRPEKRNALNAEIIGELLQAFAAASECECGVVVLTGAGPAFCAGLDMEQLASVEGRTVEEHRRDSELMAGVLRALHDFPKPVIAAVNGAAIAGGMGLATIADFTIASPDAKFGYTEVRVGFVPAIAASFMIRQFGEKRTRDLLLSGRLLKAQEALELGLITQVVAEPELLPTAYALARGLLQNSPQAMQAVKKLLAKHSSRRLDEELEDSIAVNTQQRSMEDFKEGVAAFLHHRKPEWPSRKYVTKPHN